MGEHGIFSRAELLNAGVLGTALPRPGSAEVPEAGTDALIRAAVKAERIERVRPGWYAVPGADPEVRAAVAAGGALTCVSVLAREGVWVPDSSRGVHVRLTDYAARRSHRPIVRCGAAVHAPVVLVDDPATAVLAASDCIRGDNLVAVLDSVLNRRLLEPGELAGLMRDRPRRVHRALAMTDGSAESGTETVMRLHLSRRRLPYRTQVFIPGVGYVDLLVGTSLVIECDSRAHHSGDAIDTDRDRDLALHALGFVPLRITYEQVFRRFSSVSAVLDRLVRARAHLRPTDYRP